MKFADSPAMTPDSFLGVGHGPGVIGERPMEGRVAFLKLADRTDRFRTGSARRGRTLARRGSIHWDRVAPLGGCVPSHCDRVPVHGDAFGRVARGLHQ